MSLIPLPWKLGLLALAVAIVGGYGFVKGRSSVRSEMDALRSSYEVAAAQAAGREAERVRMWSNAITVAGAKFDERAKIADSSFDASLDRLRNAYSTGARLRPPAGAAGTCDETGRATAAELLGMGETLARLVQSADRDRAALVACIGAWPR